MMDNKCANIFSKTLHVEFLYHWDEYCILLTDCTYNVCMHLFMGYIVSSFHILQKRIFVSF